MYNKIYIIGSVASGKTTLATHLSNKLNIASYELDKIIYDDDKGNVKRTEEEVKCLFDKIINKKVWIIEDVGRKIFIEGLQKADVVYYLKMSKVTIYKRCITRWLKQKLNLETYNYKPTLKSLFQMLKWAKDYFKNETTKIEYINSNSKNIRILKRKDIKKLTEETNKKQKEVR